jgi:hypothetical protein
LTARATTRATGTATGTAGTTAGAATGTAGTTAGTTTGTAGTTAGTTTGAATGTAGTTTGTADWEQWESDKRQTGSASWRRRCEPWAKSPKWRSEQKSGYKAYANLINWNCVKAKRIHIWNVDEEYLLIRYLLRLKRVIRNGHCIEITDVIRITKTSVTSEDIIHLIILLL